MKMKFTALLLTSIICMAGAASCGKVETATDSSVKLDIVTTTADGNSTEETTTASEVTTTADGETTTAAGETTATGVVASADASADATTAANTEAPAATEAPTEVPAQQQEQPQNTDAPANNETAQEVKFSLDDLLKNGADTIAALGGSPSTSVSPACTNNGCDIKIYDYAGELEVQCYVDGGTEYLCDYVIKGGSYATSKGIKIGSSRADVEAAYGAGEVSGSDIIYMEGDKQLIISFNGDTVSKIEFYVAV